MSFSKNCFHYFDAVPAAGILTWRRICAGSRCHQLWVHHTHCILYLTLTQHLRENTHTHTINVHFRKDKQPFLNYLNVVTYSGYTLTKYGTQYTALCHVSGLVTLEIFDYPLKLVISN